MTTNSNDIDANQTNELNAYFDEVFERRIYDNSLEQILAKYPEADRTALTTQLGDMARRLDSLIRATNKSYESVSLDSMLVRLVALITEAFDADRSSLFLYDVETDELFSRVAEGELINEIRFDADSGIAGSVFQSNETLIVDNAYADSRFNPEIDLKTGYKTRTILCVPVRTRRGGTIGVAEVLNKREASFTQADATLLRAFTTHMAAAVENIHLAERARVTIREESRIMEVTQAISSELDIDRLLRKIMSISSELLDAERSTLFLHDSTKDELWSRVAEGLERKEIRFPATAGIAGEVFSSQQGVNIPDAYGDERFNPAIDRDTGFKTRSILCVPVIGKHGVPIGVVQVLNRRGGPFTKRDQRRLEMLSAQSAIALDNARLFREVLEERNYSENVLRSLTNGVMTFDTQQNVVKINDAAARIMQTDSGRILGANAVSIFRADNRWIVDSLAKVAKTRRTDVSLDAEIITSGNDVSSVNLSISPLVDSQGEALGSTMVIEDITSEKRVRATMARYMTREIAEQVLENGASVLGGRAQLATVVFTDIKDFTTLSERIGPIDTVSLLNEYFTQMVEVVFAHHGILDKYIGDAIMAVFGAPFSSPRDADNAVQMALEMREVLRQFNTNRVTVRRQPLEIRIGINSDQVVAGNIGSQRRMDYTVIGDGVNLAARLESANKQLGTNLLISGMTADLLQDDYHMRELDLLRVRGKTNPVPVFEVIAGAEQTLPQSRVRQLSKFADGLRAYRNRDWSRAVKHFADALTLEPLDKPSELLLKRAQHYTSNSPPEDWDGVWTLQDK